MSEKNNLNKEKLFKKFRPRSRVQLDIVKNLREHLVNSNQESAPKIISYQNIIKENGEYYLLSDAEKDIIPLAEYLSSNSVGLKYLLEEFKLILETINNFADFEQLNSLFPEGINAANFWIDKNENIYLMPQAFLEIRQSYSSIDFEVPSAEYFKPPEIISGANWDKKAYLFNLAAVFYYFLSGEKIFADQDRARVLNKIQSEKILEIKYLISDIPESLNILLMQMLSKDESERGDFEQILEKLSLLLDNSKIEIKLPAFSHRENMLENKSISRKRKKENIKLYFQQNWKIILFFMVVGAGLFFGLFSQTPAVITEDTEAEQVVNYFYEGLSRKNMNLIDEASEVRLGEMQRIISESHVVEKMKSAFSQSDSENENEQVYSLENIRIAEESLNDDTGIFRVNYDFKFTDQEESYSISAEDQLILKKVDGIWKITEIKGSLAQMIEGDYPWRE